jgi:hypothetical protein
MLQRFVAVLLLFSYLSHAAASSQRCIAAFSWQVPDPPSPGYSG